MAAAVDTLDDDVERAVARRDAADDVLIGFDRVRERSFRTIAWLAQPRGQAGVEDDVELMRQRRDVAVPLRRIQINTGRVDVALAGRGHEAEERSARRVAAERIGLDLAPRRAAGPCVLP